MSEYIFYPANNTPALLACADALGRQGYKIAAAPHAGVTHLLLPVPSFGPEGKLRGGGALHGLFSELPPDITVCGGHLPPDITAQYTHLDLLKDPEYVLKNASITAHCAIKVALRHMEHTLQACPVLVIGWGRIGKSLARLLRGLDARVTVAARREQDRALLRAFGYRTVSTEALDPTEYRVIFNTAPVMLLPQGAPGLSIELASRPGIGGSHVISALGLPGKEAPESSGILIAETVLRRIKEDNT